MSKDAISQYISFETKLPLYDSPKTLQTVWKRALRKQRGQSRLISPNLGFL